MPSFEQHASYVQHEPGGGVLAVHAPEVQARTRGGDLFAVVLRLDVGDAQTAMMLTASQADQLASALAVLAASSRGCRK